MTLPVFFHPGFEAPIGNHIMPMKKFSLVAKSLQSEPQIEMRQPPPLQPQEILKVHSLSYFSAIQRGEPRSLAESQKFPWSPALLPSVLLTNGGVFSAAQEALQGGYSAALASGFHHAHKNQGEGFCTFNGLIIALQNLKDWGKIETAAVLDMDLHYGNGTAQLVKDRPWIKVLSIYGNDYWDNKAYRDVSILRHTDGSNHFSAALPAGCKRVQLLEIMENHLPKLISDRKPDLLLYQAGADPYFEDPYSPLALTKEDLQERDYQVFQFAKMNSIPIAWVLAGGYTPEIQKIVQIHFNTFQAWKKCFI